ncbi:MAG: hypothetical protein ACE5OS_02455 [Anaerolineae bacterium]
MISARVLETIKPLVAQLTPVERLELIHWITGEGVKLDKSGRAAEKTPQDSWRAQISAEAEAWYARPDEDRQPYLGQYVAVKAGRVIDHDSDRVVLYFRVRNQYPNTPVLITSAEARRPREFLVLSPRLEHD